MDIILFCEKPWKYNTEKTILMVTQKTYGSIRDTVGVAL